MQDRAIIIICAAVIYIAGAVAGGIVMRKMTMYEAYTRGLAVECIGKSGYYWECGE